MIVASCIVVRNWEERSFVSLPSSPNGNILQNSSMSLQDTTLIQCPGCFLLQSCSHTHLPSAKITDLEWGIPTTTTFHPWPPPVCSWPTHFSVSAIPSEGIIVTAFWYFIQVMACYQWPMWFSGIHPCGIHPWFRCSSIDEQMDCFHSLAVRNKAVPCRFLYGLELTFLWSKCPGVRWPSCTLVTARVCLVW